jgi:hypothetical protein
VPGVGQAELDAIDVGVAAIDDEVPIIFPIEAKAAPVGRGDPAILRPARQYCGQLGKQDNCQVAVTLSLANHDASLPVAYRLYLPEDWAKDQTRRHKAKLPETIALQTKPEITLEQIKAARTAGLAQGVVLMDAGYGNDTSCGWRSAPSA